METIYSLEFEKWIRNLKDKLAKTNILRKIENIEKNGNLGDFKNLGGKLCEMRFHISKGYRVYFSMINGKLIILLNGGDKSTQDRDIEKARQILQDYLKGANNE